MTDVVARRGMFESTSGDASIVAFGWWLRFVWGVSCRHRPRRIIARGYGYTFVGVRLWPLGVDRRIVAFQFRRALEHDRRFASSCYRGVRS